MFDHCASLEDAHCLSAFLFGAKEARHFATEDDRSTDSINVSTKEEEPFVYLLSSHSRTSRIRRERGFIRRTVSFSSSGGKIIWSACRKTGRKSNAIFIITGS